METTKHAGYCSISPGFSTTFSPKPNGKRYFHSCRSRSSQTSAHSSFQEIQGDVTCLARSPYRLWYLGSFISLSCLSSSRKPCRPNTPGEWGCYCYCGGFSHFSSNTSACHPHHNASSMTHIDLPAHYCTYSFSYFKPNASSDTQDYTISYAYTHPLPRCGRQFQRDNS